MTNTEHLSWNLSWISADGAEINVDNPGEYTIVSVERSLPGQFEQTQSTTESGSWLEPPQLDQEGDRSVVTIVATLGRFEIEIEGLNVEVLNDDSNDESVPVPPMLPVTMLPIIPSVLPTSPYSLPELADRASPETRSTSVTCHVCGHVGQPDDRFCAQCGTALY